MSELIRYDLQIIAQWIEPGTRVLDLGCGKGDLLLYLKEHKNVIGAGIESSEEKVAECVAKGLSVLQGDFNEEVEDYEDGFFDYVIVSLTLQQVHDPLRLIHILTRIGRGIVVSFPNFAHWRSRLQCFFLGVAPKTRQLPFEWYNTPNIRVITIKDFRRFAQDAGLTILKEAAINTDSEDRRGRIISRLPNLLATYGIMLIAKERNRVAPDSIRPPAAI